MSDSESSDAPSLAEPKPPLVLVVDDEDAIREALCDLLEDAGFATIGARHGLDALRALATLPTAPAFILLDLMMPIMDGWQVLEHLRQDERLARVPVVVITAFGDLGSASQLPVLRKPIELKDLLEVVHTHCRARA